MEEVSVPDGSVYVKENTESTPTSVKYKIPCTEGDTTQSTTTNLISDKPTRVRFEKRDSKYNYLIQDETTTFEVYKCAKGTECHPADYVTKEEREKNGMTLVKLPITVKNLSNDENHLNMFYSNIYDPSDKKLTKQSTYFDDTIDYADDLKSGESYTKYYYFEYTTDGTYKVKFNNYTSKIDVNVAIKK